MMTPGAAGVRERRERSFEPWQEPGAAELCAALGGLEGAVDFVAELHLRGARHPLVPEVRWRARDHGVHFFTSNVRDAVAALEALVTPPRDVPEAFAGARERLLQCLYALRDDAPRRVRLMEEAGGPDTLLHGDLWPKNVFVSMTPAGPRA